MPRLLLRLIVSALLVLPFWIWLSFPAAARPPVHRMSLPNKMVLLLSEEHSLPFVTIQVVIDGGSRQDPKTKEGLAFITVKGLLLGTSKQKAPAINEALDFMGASLNGSANQDYATISLRVLKKDLEKGLTLLADTIRPAGIPRGRAAKRSQ